MTTPHQIPSTANVEDERPQTLTSAEVNRLVGPLTNCAVCLADAKEKTE